MSSDFLTIPRVLWRRRKLERSCRWTRTRLLSRQAEAVAGLRRFAAERSPFYRRFHQGLESRPLQDLPVLTKALLMENFDEVVTDRAVRLRDLESFLSSEAATGLFRGRYVVLATSGSTGFRGLFLFDPDEWLDALASILRPMLWAGAAPNPLKPPRVAMLTSTTSSHYSCRVSVALSSRFMPTLQLDAGEPIATMVARLNQWQPEFIGAYPSVLREIAGEQLAGRLRIQPRKIGSSGELLTDADRRRVREAWDLPVWDTYGCTEYTPIAAECAFGRKHLLEDGAVIEIERDRLLLTVLDRRTQPLIRYEVSDVVRSVEGDCECGRPFRMIEGIEGRVEDVLHFGTVQVHPNRFHSVLETVPASGWQVIHEPDGLHVLLTGVRDPAAIDAVHRSVREMLVSAGAAVPAIRVSEVAQLHRGSTGKAPLILSRI